MGAPLPPSRQLKVAIIGGGPAGLAVAIELGKLDFVDWKLYEKKPAISEIGTGITIQRNTWRMLELMGAARNLSAGDFFRPESGHETQHRNGRTGQLIGQQRPRADTPLHRHPCRVYRAKLQQALLKEVDHSRIRVGRKLVRVSRLGDENEKLQLFFEDGFTDEVDILVGADGIRSVVRNFAFPEHRIKYTGAIAYRTVVRRDEAMKINGLVPVATFWHGTDGKWIYTCPLDEHDFEITTRAKSPATAPAGDEKGGEHVSWGRDAPVEGFVQFYREMASPIRQLLGLATYVQRFDHFAGPCLRSVVTASIALVGDASHPLSGAFGAGAGFALEDAYVLAGALRWARGSGRPASGGLDLFDKARTPHYAALFGLLDESAQAEREMAARGPVTPDDEIRHRVENSFTSGRDWVYVYEADTALKELIEEVEGRSNTLSSAEPSASSAKL
ncbi:hypothetical protein GGS23DRAFT_370613 [Durotheca rogersii]|uniref:uncharacterized protein n=1 Tax=Durotheca rogersii TaxID=419775 RepID=UPI00222096A7|nr:uncharacterized protein GGS23DRAFT_370613 [Durotheca rogersii]KAI5866125.1 hypothetical protein GGS23DRAFT_370613 [Durotheca rogersii]